MERFRSVTRLQIYETSSSLAVYGALKSDQRIQPTSRDKRSPWKPCTLVGAFSRELSRYRSAHVSKRRTRPTPPRRRRRRSPRFVACQNRTTEPCAVARWNFASHGQLGTSAHRAGLLRRRLRCLGPTTRYFREHRYRKPADLTVVAKRYERASTLITTNQLVTQSGQVSGDDVLAAAILDRLLHHSHTLVIPETATVCARRKKRACSDPAPRATAAFTEMDQGST
jgi:hypothetical protein